MVRPQDHADDPSGYAVPAGGPLNETLVAEAGSRSKRSGYDGREHAAPIHVAFCIDNLSAAGGTELNAVRTAERLHPDGCRITLVSMAADGPMKARYEAAGIRVAHFSPGGSLLGRAALHNGRRLARFFADERVDVVHCHDVYSNFFCALAGRAAGRAVITSKRWTYTAPKHQPLNVLGYRASDAILANSGTVADSLRASRWIPGDRVVVVPNFVDDAAFAPIDEGRRARLRERFGVPADAAAVGIMARLRPEKNHPLLLRAVARLADRHPALHVVVVGDGPECDALRALAVELGIGDRVHLVGHVAGTEFPQQSFDVATLCSLHEGFPNAVVEAMAAGRPVVATDVGGVRDAVVDGETGFLVPSNEVSRFAEALERLLADRPRAERMGATGRVVASERYRADSVLGVLQAVYTRLVAASRRSR